MDITSSMLHSAPGGLETGKAVSPTATAARPTAEAVAKRTANLFGTAGEAQKTAPTMRRMPLPAHVELDIDRGSGRVVGRFIDNQTGDIVRQVPTEEMLRLLAKTRELIGTLFDEMA
jgi:flagellar protein FlaG